MDCNLEEKYNISKWEALCCKLIRIVRGTNTPPHFLYKYSKKHYGWKDNLARYWWDKYYGISVGKYTYGYRYIYNRRLSSVGAFCSIGPNQLIVPNDHRLDLFTNSPVATMKEFGFVDKDTINEYWTEEKCKVTIGNDVWIGANCIIFEGVTIGDGAVIAAGSIVRKNVPPYAIVVGVDRVVRYRFEMNKVEHLLNIKWWCWTDEIIRKNIKNIF